MNQQEDEVLQALKTGQNTENTEANVLIRIDTLRTESDDKKVSSATNTATGTSKSKEMPMMSKIEENVIDVDYKKSPKL